MIKCPVWSNGYWEMPGSLKVRGWKYKVTVRKRIKACLRQKHFKAKKNLVVTIIFMGLESIFTNLTKTHRKNENIFFTWYETIVVHECLVTQSCLTLCNPLESSPPGYSIHGILQGGILKWLPCPPPGIFPPRNLTCVSCIAGGFFTSWAIREAQTIVS